MAKTVSIKYEQGGKTCSSEKKERDDSNNLDTKLQSIYPESVQKPQSNKPEDSIESPTNQAELSVTKVGRSSTESLRQLSLQINDLIDDDAREDHTSGVSELERRNQELAARLSAEQQKCEQFEQQIKAYHSRVSELQLEADRVAAEVETRLARELGPLQEQLQLHVQTVGILVGEKTELQAALAKSRQTAKQKSGEVEELQGRMKAAKQLISDLEKEVSSKAESGGQVDKANRELSQELDRLRLEHRMLGKQLEETEEEASELRQKLSARTSDCAALRQDLQDKQSQLALTQLRVQQLSLADNPEVDSQLESLHQHKISLERQLAELQQTLKTVAAERDQASQQYQQYVQQLNTQVTSLAAKVSSTSLTAKVSPTGLTAKVSSTGLTTEVTPTSLAAKVSPTSLAAKVSPTSLAAKVSPTSLAAKVSSTSLTTEVTPTSLAAKVSSTSLAAKVSPTSLAAKVSPTSLAAKVSPTSLAAKVSSNNLTTKVSSTSLAAKVSPTSLAAKVSSNSFTAKVSPTSLASKVNSTSLASKVSPTSLAAKLSPTSLASKLEQVSGENEQLSAREQGLVRHVSDLEKQLQQHQQAPQGTQALEQRLAVLVAEKLELSGEIEAKEVYPHLCGGRVENHFGKTTLGTPDRDSNFDLSVVGSLVQHERDALDHAAAESEEMQHLHLELEEKDQRVEELESLVEQLQGDQPDQHKLLAAMESDKVAASRAVGQNQQLKKQLEELQEGFVRVSNNKLELTEKLQYEQHISKELAERLAQQETELNELRGRLEEKDRQIQSLEQNSRELSTQVLQHNQITDRMRHYEAQGHFSDQLQQELQQSKERIQALSKQNTELRTLLAQSDSRDANTQDGSTPTTDRKDDMLATLSASVRQLELERDQLLEQLKGLQVTEGDVTASPEESAPLSSNEDEKKLTAMEQLEERFTRTMKEVAELSDEKQRLEHLVLQLQGETETIGEYIALYQTQRIVLRQRARDKDEQLARLAQDREDLRSKLANLNNLVHRLVGGQEGTRVGDADTVQSQVVPNGDVPDAEIATENWPVDKTPRSTEIPPEKEDTASKIMSLLTEIQTSNLVDPHSSENFHPCPWCSGQLITV
uniref:Golgin subfamily A conserved domain-containing protein n=1 Tax=Timema tahoe TaxID=61484 RepID=A0A7R9ID73_9NEOP|nr:unnamed protein product [Timema tahoe]